MDRIGIRQATKSGYIVLNIPGVADFSYPTSQLRRGRVQDGGKVCPTITTTGGICKVVKWQKQ